MTMSRNRSDWLSAVRDDDFHPELRRIARVLPRGPVGPRTLPLIRVLTGLGLPRRRDDVEVLTLPTGGAIRLFRPTGQSGLGAALLWIHGGGYVVGRACQDDMLCRRFGLALGITVASVEYRLAPEHPYPAGLEDCYRALARLASLPDVDPARIAVGGASAGSGLAAALNQLARDRGEINPAFQLLSYPMLDDRTADGGPFQRQYRTWNQRSNRFGWQSYLGAAGPDIAVPARRDDLTRLAPAGSASAHSTCSTRRTSPTPND
jgi:acetyl esterase/lipase